jgi:3-oxoacyl-[acyl-carrier protein] reductase
MDHGLKNKVALITGASRGLGKATAEALASEGARIVIVARGASELAAIESAYAGRCVAVVGDLKDPALPQRAVDTAMNKFGALDIVVVNTGGPPPLLPLDTQEADFEAAFQTAFYPAIRLIQAAAKPMCERKWGRILIVSSTSVKAPKPFLSLSAAARSALWAWSKSAAPTLFENGVTINAIFAGPHDTDRARELGSTAKVMGRPDDFGTFVAALSGEATRFITGTGYVVDGGEFRGT